MSLRDQKGKRFFISIIHGSKRDNHKVLINERFFNLNNLNRWRLYLKLILQYVNYLFENSNKDLNLFLKGVIKEVKEESKQFRRSVE